MYDLKRRFENREVCQLTGVKQRELIHWSERGLIGPLADPNGAGTRRKYLLKHVLQVALLVELRRYGIGRSQLSAWEKQAPREFDRIYTDAANAGGENEGVPSWLSIYPATDGTLHVHWDYTADALGAEYSGVSSAFVINLQVLRQSILEKIRTL